MKHILVLIALLVSSVAIAQNYTLQKVEFSSMARGYSESLEISKDSVINSSNDRINNSNSRKNKPIGNKEWKDLIKIISAIELSRMGSLPSPTNKRQHDGARHSKITIVTSAGAYSHLFDDDNPHKELGGLMKCITAIKGGLK